VKRYFSVVSVLTAWGLGLAFLPSAQATTVVNEFTVNYQGKVWCSNQTVRKVNTKEFLTLTSDPLNNGNGTLVAVSSINSFGLPPVGRETIQLLGSAYNNRRGRSGELAVSGVLPENPFTFFTLRGRYFFGKDGQLSKVTGTWVSNEFPIGFPSCIGTGTFKTVGRIF
jgi:hypothetical protein